VQGGRLRVGDVVRMMPAADAPAAGRA
jgi:hypothetical protein